MNIEFQERDYLDGETDDQYIERKARERERKEESEMDQYLEDNR